MTKPKNSYVVQGKYAYGWEDLCASDSFVEAKQDIQTHRDNEGGYYRIVIRPYPKTKTRGE